jgi:mRNA interferase RelE/StbE
MEYAVLVHKKAKDAFDGLDAETRQRIKKALQELAKDPFKPRPNADIKKLTGTKGRKAAYRLRVGEHRIVYDIEGKSVFVTIIFHRGKEYTEL